MNTQKVFDQNTITTMHICNVFTYRSFTLTTMFLLLRKTIGSSPAIVLVIILFSVTSCSSLNKGSRAKDSNEGGMSQENNLEKIELYVGKSTKTYFVSKNWIAGIDVSTLESSQVYDFVFLLRELKLERVQGQDGFSDFSEYCPWNNSNVSMDSAIVRLRERFGPSFGPALYSKNKSLKGALLNEIKLSFRDGLSEEEQLSIINTAAGANSISKKEGQFTVLIFDNHRVSEAIEIAGKLLDHQDVISVFNAISAPPERVKQKSWKSIEKLSKSEFMNGDKSIPVWTNESLIVGLALVSPVSKDSMHEVMNEFDLKPYGPKSIGMSFGGNIGSGGLNYSFLAHSDGSKILHKGSPELKRLRELYMDSFGPGIYSESGEVRGVLSNFILVTLASRKEMKDLDPILKRTKALGAVRYRGNQYRIEYPKEWGYKVLEVGSQLLRHRIITSVENETRVIISNSNR